MTSNLLPIEQDEPLGWEIHSYLDEADRTMQSGSVTVPMGPRIAIISSERYKSVAAWQKENERFWGRGPSIIVSIKPLEDLPPALR